MGRPIVKGLPDSQAVALDKIFLCVKVLSPGLPVLPECVEFYGENRRWEPGWKEQQKQGQKQEFLAD